MIKMEMRIMVILMMVALRVAVGRMVGVTMVVMFISVMMMNQYDYGGD